MEECGGCARKCKRVAEEEASSMLKRMRTRDSPETELILKNRDFHNLNFPVIYPQNSSGIATGHSGFSCCSDHHSLASSRSSSSTESCEVVNEIESRSKSTDLEVKSPESVAETESSTCINSKSRTRETTPVSELCSGECNVMEPQPKKQPPSRRRRSSTAGKKPPSAEIEDFFSASEKREQQRFAEKYNFDIVKDVPLEGRYQWVRLKP